MSASMRAKFVINSIERSGTTEYPSETLKMSAVTNGTPEDNTFSKFTPSASLSLTVNNPTLLGQFNPGEKFYVDFTPAN